MRISDLTAYAAEKYRIEEIHKWSDFPGFSVLCHPETGKWVALLMRQWNSDLGEEIERCDIKCGHGVPMRPYITSPFRMQGDRWQGIAFNDETEETVVFSLLDRAISEGSPSGYKIVLASQLPVKDNAYRETPLPFSSGTNRSAQTRAPERIREMRRLYEYGRESVESRAENFYNQAVFMRDYEDDYPWSGDFVCYFPTYHDLTTNQLRGYFSWRKNIRKGDFKPISASAAYIYIYELLNGVGADSPTDAIDKLKAFDEGFIGAGFGNDRMRQNIRRWMFELAIIKALPIDFTAKTADPEVQKRDISLSVLKTPEEFSDNEIFDALCILSGKKTWDSPVIKADSARGMRLFAEAWKAIRSYRREDKPFFQLCFGKKVSRRWHPLANAVYYTGKMSSDADYLLNPCRNYRCRNGIWTVTAYDKQFFNLELLRAFIRLTDALLRRYLKTGKYLKENPEDEWAAPFILAVIEADKNAAAEASKPKITIDLSELDKIRADSDITRDSLLTEDETDDFEELPEPLREVEKTDIPLDETQIKLIRLLLSGGDVSGLLKSAHLMPSVAADSINEALFDDIGDTVLLCENGILALVDDYIDDLERLLGGNSNG
ncbi:MAG: TerB N-terminal domain-containing protein [Clostridia bacterium]|nr:TerB N-terminal domain-containing protein [Clostridia bacterium]